MNPQILGDVGEKDRTRQAGFACIGHAAVVAKGMVEAARGAHADATLSMPERHRKAHELAAKAAAPFADTIAKTSAIYAKEQEKLNETLAAPKGEFSEQRLMDAASKLSGIQPHKRFAEVKKNIDRGSDLLIAVFTRGDDFIVGDLLTEAEKAVAISHWRQVRFPAEADRLHRIELDLEVIGNIGKILEGQHRACANQTIVASGELPPTPAVRGAVGPQPRDRGRSPGLVERAAHMTAVLAARG